jgi:hypothetical protein
MPEEKIAISTPTLWGKCRKMVSSAGIMTKGNPHLQPLSPFTPKVTLYIVSRTQLLPSPILASTTTKPHSPVPRPHGLAAALVDPPGQIATLAHVKVLERLAPINDGVDAQARDAHAPAHRQRSQVEQVARDDAQRRVRHRGAAEGEVQVLQRRAAEGEDFGGNVRERAAEGL